MTAIPECKAISGTAQLAVEGLPPSLGAWSHLRKRLPVIPARAELPERNGIEPVDLDRHSLWV
jgi:hypothetical protein